MEFSPQQATAIDEVGAWLKGGSSSPQTYYLAGYAGTGKTTLAKHLASLQEGETIFAAYTGKAASVLQKKACPGAQTIHSLIYRVQQPDKEFIKDLQQKIKSAGASPKGIKLEAQLLEANKPKFLLNEESPLADADLLVIDECSMVGPEIGQDLLSFGKKILVLGDPGQLPPVEGAGFFTSGKPNLLLTEIHRQAQGNPIINMATLVRQGGRLRVGTYGDSKVCTRSHEVDFTEYDQLIVGLNRTRKAFNAAYRDNLGWYGSVPMVGDKLICLKNNREVGLLNGTQWGVEEATDEGTYIKLAILPWDNEGEANSPAREPLRISAHHFDVDLRKLMWWDRKRAEEFDFGYAITCHKSQGSQWEKIFIQNESYAFREDASRWLYTALTRAEDTVTVRL